MVDSVGQDLSFLAIAYEQTCSSITGSIVATDVEGLSNTVPYAVTTAASNGFGSIDDNGNLVYTPNLNFHGMSISHFDT